MVPVIERSFEFVRAEDAGDAHAFRSGIQEYLVRRGDGSFAAVRVRWDEALLAELAALREEGGDPALPRRLGDRLAEWFGEALDLGALPAASRGGEEVRLRVVSSAAELYALPWELLTLPGSGAHLGAAASVQLSYRWPAAGCAAPAGGQRPEGGRILFAWSRAFGPVGEGPIAGALAAAARDGYVSWDRATDELGELTLPGLIARLEADVAAGRAPAVLHLLCHGAAIGEGYGLGLDDGRGGRAVVDSGALARALAPFARQIRLVVLMACDSGNAGAPGTRLGSAAQELHRAGFEAVVASRLPLSGAAALEFTATLYRELLVETRSVEAAFAAARARLLRLPGSLDWASVQLYQHALAGSDRRPIVFRPYRGLLAFEDRHARFFYGRDQESAEMLGDLEALRAAGLPRFLVVAGASGTGKSSVVLAGVRPALTARGWASAVIRPGHAPQAALAGALARRPAGEPYALVVDQFEEVFTHAAPAEAAAFARALWALAQGEDGAVVVITLRVDFLGRCGELTLDDARTRLDQVAYDERHRIFVARMSTARLAEAVTRPAERLGLRFEEGLAARLLKDVGDEPGALPLLQYALDALWVQRAGDLLTHATLDAIGGVGGAMTRHADAAIARLDEDARRHARRTLVRLVTYGADMASGTRRRVALAEVRPQQDATAWQRAIEALVEARLLQSDEEHGTIEVSHEALIRRWPVLWDWYQADRDRLSRQTELRELIADARRYGVLLLGRALERARELAQEFSDEVWPEARELISRSVRSRRLKRARRVVVSAILLALVVALAIVGTTYSVRTELARQDLARALDLSRDNTRVSAAERLLEAEPWAAAALLREVEHPELPRWRPLAFAATQEPLPARVLPGARPPGVFAPEGEWFVTGHADGDLRVWTRRGPAWTLPQAAPGGLVALALAGETLAALREEGLEVWDVGGEEVALVDAAPVRGRAVQVAAGRVAVQGEDGRVRIWEARAEELRALADDLPCSLLSPGALRCEGPLGEEVRGYADPDWGAPLPARLVDARVSAWGGVSGAFDRGGRVGAPAAWDGAAFVEVGPLAEGAQFLGDDPWGGLILARRTLESGDMFTPLCRRGSTATCLPLPPSCEVAHASAAELVAECQGAWQVIDRGSLAPRQVIRRPLATRGTLVDRGAGWLATFGEDRDAWLWRLGEGARTWPIAQAAGAAGVDVSRGRSAALEERGEGVELVVRELDAGGWRELVRRSLPRPADPGPTLLVEGDAVALLAWSGEALVTTWIELDPARVVVGAAPAGAAVPAAIHARSRRLLRAEGAAVILDEFAGPAARRVGSAQAAPPCAAIQALAFAPAGDVAAVGCDSGDVAVLELPSLHWLAYVASPSAAFEAGVTSLAFGTTSEALAIGRISGAVDQVRRGAEGPALTRLAPLHKAMVTGLHWSASGLASADWEGQVALWPDPAGRDPPLVTRFADLPGVTAIGLTPGGRLLAASASGVILERHARVEVAGLAGLLRERATYCPTQEERIAWLGEGEAEASARVAACAARE